MSPDLVDRNEVLDWLALDGVLRVAEEHAYFEDADLLWARVEATSAARLGQDIEVPNTTPAVDSLDWATSALLHRSRSWTADASGRGLASVLGQLLVDGVQVAPLGTCHRRATWVDHLFWCVDVAHLVPAEPLDTECPEPVGGYGWVLVEFGNGLGVCLAHNADLRDARRGSGHTGLDHPRIALGPSIQQPSDGDLVLPPRDILLGFQNLFIALRTRQRLFGLCKPALQHIRGLVCSETDLPG